MENEIQEIKDRTGVDPEKAIIITKMMEEFTLQKVERINPLQIVKANLERINDIIQNQMSDGRHYGEIPGTGRKALRLSGQDLLLMNFSMRPAYSSPVITNFENYHREYLSTCYLYKFIDIDNSLLVGEGTGSCSTLEEKYSKRWQPINYTPSAKYWELIKGKKYSEAKRELPADVQNRKINDKWAFCKQVPNDNVPDLYNTVLKMSRIRAKREAVQTLFAVSGAFDFVDPDDPLDKAAEIIPPGNLPTADLPAGASSKEDIKEGQSNNGFFWESDFTDLIDPNWFHKQLENAKSKKEIRAFMDSHKKDMAFFSDDLQQKIREKATTCFNKFK